MGPVQSKIADMISPGDKIEDMITPGGKMGLPGMGLDLITDQIGTDEDGHHNFSAFQDIANPVFELLAPPNPYTLATDPDEAFEESRRTGRAASSMTFGSLDRSINEAADISTGRAQKDWEKVSGLHTSSLSTHYAPPTLTGVSVQHEYVRAASVYECATDRERPDPGRPNSHGSRGHGR